MIADMAKRIRLIIDTDEELRLAVRLAATKADASPSEIVNELIRKHLQGEVADARKYLPKKRKEEKE